MSRLILPKGYQNNDPAQSPPVLALKHSYSKARNALLDLIYVQVQKGLDNEKIAKVLKKKKMSPLPPERMNDMREFFKKAEHHHPAKMAEMRRRLGISA